MPDLSHARKKARIVIGKLRRLFPDATTALIYANSLELLIAVMLSAQCTDKKVNEVTTNLFKKYTTPDDYIRVPLSTLAQDIRQINYYKTKATRLQHAMRVLRDSFDGDVPRSIEELMTLPGVGRKTALVVLANAHNIVSGIAVDTHVIRLSQKFGLTSHTDPKNIEKDLQHIIPRDQWRHFTNRMIAYGRIYSPAHKRHDETDPVSIALKNASLQDSSPQSK
jgi:endonuclease III